ncbi:MAG TPA: Ig-like domain-containing protein [Gemmatimonadales bacterium]|nr:Ig-like domain-containing protein [Gemmatimonadales bacterium]
MPAPLSLVLIVWLVAQGVAPLRKSDLVRLLSGSVMSQEEMAQLVRRNCLSFAPTDRDRADFQRLGAEAPVLAAVDACARRASRPVVTTRPPSNRVTTPTPTPVTRSAPTPQPPPPRAPPPVHVSPDRSGFVAGGGQSGPAGQRLPRALVFEARDSAGKPLAGQTVTFTGINARIEPPSPATDVEGRVRVAVILAERTGSAIVLAVAGDVEKQAAFRVTVGTVSQLVVACGASDLSGGGRVVLRPDTVAELRVSARDAYGNGARLSGLRAAVADARILRVQRIAEDSIAGTVTLRPDQAGTTSLALIANGLRQYVTVTVPPRAAPGKTDCP